MQHDKEGNSIYINDNCKLGYAGVYKGNFH